MLTRADLDDLRMLMREELALALHPSVRRVSGVTVIDGGAALSPANDPNQPDQPPPPAAA